MNSNRSRSDIMVQERKARYILALYPEHTHTQESMARYPLYVHCLLFLAILGNFALPCYIQTVIKACVLPSVTRLAKVDIMIQGSIALVIM